MELAHVGYFWRQVWPCSTERRKGTGVYGSALRNIAISSLSFDGKNLDSDMYFLLQLQTQWVTAQRTESSIPY